MEECENLQEQQHQELEQQPQSQQVESQPMDNNFMKYLFSFRKSSVAPLQKLWAGWVYDSETERWELPDPCYPIMNKKGISWGISLIDSYINPIFITTSLTEESFKFRMLEVCKVIWNSLSMRYEEFGMVKSDIARVGEEIESKIHAILEGCMNNGFRDFLTKQYSVTEQITHNQPTPTKSGMFNGLFGGFGRK